MRNALFGLYSLGLRKGERVEKINERLEHYEKIRKFSVLTDDLPEEVRSVTAFQKVKVDRKAVSERYKKEIETLYSHQQEGCLSYERIS